MFYALQNSFASSDNCIRKCIQRLVIRSFDCWCILADAGSFSMINCLTGAISDRKNHKLRIVGKILVTLSFKYSTESLIEVVSQEI